MLAEDQERATGAVTWILPGRHGRWPEKGAGEACELEFVVVQLGVESMRGLRWMSVCNPDMPELVFSFCTLYTVHCTVYTKLDLSHTDLINESSLL